MVICIGIQKTNAGLDVSQKIYAGFREVSKQTSR
jgi:hypothetical protein